MKTMEMKKRRWHKAVNIALALALVLVVSLGIVALPMASTLEAGPGELHVGPGQTYTAIQDAVDAASDGDTILVAAGNYTENVDVDGSLTLQGERSAVVTVTAANSTYHVFEVTAANVTISGFTVKGATGNKTAGIYVDKVGSCNITANTCLDNYYGIYLDNSSNNTLTSNTASSNTECGIYLDNSGNNTLTSNTANSNTKYGIYLDGPAGSNGNTLTGNTANQNGECGIYVDKSSSNTLTSNTANSNTEYGIYLDNSGSNNLAGNAMSGNSYNFHVAGSSLPHYVQVIDNTNTVDGKPVYYLVGASGKVIGDSTNAGYVGAVNSTNVTVKDLTLTKGGQGVLFAYTSHSSIENVTVSNNYYGIYLDNSDNNTLTSNCITSNNIGVKIEGSVDASTISINFNNIHGNTEYGVVNSGSGTADATNNWWGANDGPSNGAGVADGSGDKVSANVHFDPWFGAGVEDSKTLTTTPDEYTVDAKTEADTEVTKSGDGTPTITVAKYESNPGGTIPSGFTATGEYIDVHLDSSDGVGQIGIKNYYTAAQVAGIDESSLRMRWGDGESWVQCSDSGVNTSNVNGYSGYVWAIITVDTTPDLTDLSGSVFSVMGTPLPPPPPPSPPVTPPSITTNDASGITTTGATLNGSLDSLGTASSVGVRIEWGTTSGSLDNKTTHQKMTATGAFSFDLSGLDHNTTYYFRAKAVGDAISYGDEKSFTTGTTPPSVTTNDASDITTTGATLNGSLTSLGTASSVDASFEWGTSSGSLDNETTPQAMNATGAFSFDLSELDHNATYYFRAKAAGDGTSYGDEESFTTGTTLPSVTTNDASDISATGATLNGSLTSLGTASSVDVSFEWGTSSGSLDNETTPQAMNATGAFSFDLSELDHNASYYFRAKAAGDGTSYGDEESFTTGTTLPSVTTNDASDITTTGATLNGNLTSLGTASSVDVSFEWGTTSGSLGHKTTAEPMNATGVFSFDLSELDPDTNYYFRAKAVGDGTSYGDEESFTTGTTLPSVTTNDASDITTTGATLNGSLDSLGTASSVDVSFEWGATSGSLGNKTTAEAMSATGVFSFDLSGLDPDTNYYFRAKAVGDAISYGSEESFTTGTTPPTVTLTAEPIQILADGTSTSTITATVKDKDGNPVADGTEVRFTTNRGSFIGGALTIDKETVDSIATAELKSIFSAEAVIATVTAKVNGSKGATSVFFIEAGGTEVIDRKVEITLPGEYTVDAKSEADTEVTKSGDGTPIVTVAKYESNPGGTIPGGFAATGEYIDVHLDSSEDVDQIEIRNYYTAAQVAGIDEASLRMRWWDGESWVPCSNSGVNTENVNGYSGYVWAIITAGTTPNLTDLAGAVLGCMGTPSPTEEEEEEEEEREVITRPLDIDILGKVTTVKVSSSGKLLESLKASDAEGQIALELDRGTKILCPGGKVPQRLEMKAIQIPPPEDMAILGQVYRLDAYLYEYSQSPCLFTISPPGKLALSYDLSELPPNSLSLFTAYYDTQKGWVELSLGDITKSGKLTVEISGPVIFTIMVKLGPPPLPGEPCFRPSNLVIEPGEAKPGQEITISLIVDNIGGAAGTCPLELKVDGEVKSVKSITLEPGESQVVSFSIIEAMEGEHIVEIADLEGDFTIVIISRPWWLLSTMGVIPIAVFAERRRRWKRRVEWSTGLKTKDWLVK